MLQRIFACSSKTAIKTPKQNVRFVKIFFISHLAALVPTFVHRHRGSLTHPVLITTLFQVRPEGHGELHNEIGSQSLAKRISRIRTRNLSILSIRCYPTVSLSPKAGFFSRYYRSFPP